ncbi:lipoprotein [Insulibacter thermoxylanivorax]|uniref:Lipoprotein n=1 Tax=Insulibacter thermoxylanivorax TaxID=2749268 RepID=A0A916VFY0_9BACL|nr:aromatic acid exporter family protein [Insulibacter thermoxylanivorax]GFR38134.1 lipoprotein [Insulibacter thermoxylanivorax]
MTLGARVLKTGLAISLSLYICRLLGLQPEVLAPVAAVIVMQPSLYGTWRHVWQQIQANTVGAVIAFLASQFIGNDLFSIGIVAVLVIAFCLKFKMGETIGLTLVTVLIIMEAPGDDIQFAVNRFSIILVGIISSLLVNVAIAPPNVRKMYEEKVKDVFASMSLLLRTAISDEMTELAFRHKRQNFDQGLLKCSEMYHVYHEEQRRMARIKHVDARQTVIYKHMLKALNKGANILEAIDGHYFQSRRDEHFAKTIHEYLDQLIRYHEYILLKVDGKAKQTRIYAKQTAESNERFMKQLLQEANQLDPHHIHLVLIGSAVYEYGLQLVRLDRLVEHQLKKRKGQPKRRRRPVTRSWKD